MRLVYSDYVGCLSDLSAHDKKCLTDAEDLWVDVPVSVQPLDKLSKDIDGSMNLRSLLEATYPNTTALHHMASETTKATRHYPISQIVRTAQEDKEDEDEDYFGLDEPPGPVMFCRALCRVTWPLLPCTGS